MSRDRRQARGTRGEGLMLRAVREARIVGPPTDRMNRPGPQFAEAARRLRDPLHPGAAP